MTHFFYLLAGIFAGISTHGGVALLALPAAALSLFFGWINRPGPSEEQRQTTPRTGTLQALGAVVEEHPPEMVPSFVDPQEWGEKSESAKQKKKTWVDLEVELDELLSDAIHMLRAMIPHTHSALIFYPGNKPNTLQVHRYASLAVEAIDNDVVIEEGKGLLGLILKKNNRHLLESDVTGAKLYYYQEPISIASFAAVPIMLNDKINGAIVLDSLEHGAFSDETISHLRVFSKMICELSYQTSTNLLHQQEREQYKELFEYQKKLMDNMSLDDIIQAIVQFIIDNIPYQRIMILLADDDHPTEQARVELAIGLHSEPFQKMEMERNSTGLLRLCFHGRKELHRTFNPGETLARVTSSEPPDNPFRSLIAFPVVEDEKSPVRMVVSVETTQHKHYSELSRNLLRNICNSAGFAYTRVRAYQEKQNLASRDGLTGLLNHRAFQERLRTETMRAKRNGAQIGLLMTDVDHFKGVNDTYGHPVGDQVLQMVAKQIQSAIREEVDLVARYGGEEFVVMITDANEEIVRETGERIRKAVEQSGLDHGKGEPLRVTISIGFALYPLHSDNAKEALDKADKALYNAKESGRNRVVGFH